VIVRVSPGLVHIIGVGRIVRRIDPEKTVGGKVRHLLGGSVEGDGPSRRAGFQRGYSSRNIRRPGPVVIVDCNVWSTCRGIDARGGEGVQDVLN